MEDEKPVKNECRLLSCPWNNFHSLFPLKDVFDLTAESNRKLRFLHLD